MNKRLILMIVVLGIFFIEVVFAQNNDAVFNDSVDQNFDSYNATHTPNIILTLINANTNRDLFEFSRGDTFDLKKVGNALNIRADVKSKYCTRVQFRLNNTKPKIESKKPYAFAGDNGKGNYYPWRPGAGHYTLEVIAYNAQKKVIASRTVRFQVTNSGSAYNTFNPTRDLISLHYDHMRDPDDAHSSAAGKTLTGAMGIVPHVVSGTYGANSLAPYRGWPVEACMKEIWGSGKWVNAHTGHRTKPTQHSSSAIRNTAVKWHGYLKRGGHVWIAEGGPSDFTAKVIKHIVNQLSFPLQKVKRQVHVVQHGRGGKIYNERWTSKANLAYVKRNTHYILLDNGNTGGNATAGLRIAWSQNKAVQNNIKNFMQAASNHRRYGAAWRAAFNYYNPDPSKKQTVDKTGVHKWRALDCSDTVQLLYILNIGVNRVKNCNDFRWRYLK